MSVLAALSGTHSLTLTSSPFIVPNDDQREAGRESASDVVEVNLWSETGPILSVGLLTLKRDCRAPSRVEGRAAFAGDLVVHSRTVLAGCATMAIKGMTTPKFRIGCHSDTETPMGPKLIQSNQPDAIWYPISSA